MKYLFGILGVLCVLSGMGTCAVAKASTHEGIGSILFLSGVVALAAGALLGELEAVHKTLRQPSEKTQDSPLPPIKD